MRYMEAVVSYFVLKNCDIDCVLMPQAAANAFVPSPNFCMSLRRFISDFGFRFVSISKKSIQIYINCCKGNDFISYK